MTGQIQSLRNTRVRPLSLLGGLFFTLVGLLGCTEQNEGPLPPNQPPVTYLSVQGVLPDTMSYRVGLSWWGSDRDGRVVGYYIRWSGPWTPPPGAERWAEDSTWVFTTATHDTVPAPTGPAAPGQDHIIAVSTFSVRAKDNLGAVDPVGKQQTFTVRNWVPYQLQWDPRLPRPVHSPCVVSFAVSAKDGDGNRTLRYQYWLDGPDSTRIWTTQDSIIVLRPDQFGDRYGRRSLAIRAIDDSGTPSQSVLRHTWDVDAPPTQRFLLIDNVSSQVSGWDVIEDPFYRNLMDRVTNGDYYILDMEQSNAFRTSRDVFPFLSLFEGVFWYSGLSDPRQATPNDLAFAAALRNAQEGIGAYLDQGGRLLLLGTNAVGDGGGLSTAFTEDRLGVFGFYRRPSADDSPPVSDIGLPANSMVYSYLGGTLDSLKTSYPSHKSEFMILQRRTIPLLMVPPGFITPYRNGSFERPVEPDQSTDPAYLGCLRESEGGGCFGVITFTLSRTRAEGNRDAIAEAVVRRVLLPASK